MANWRDKEKKEASNKGDTMTAKEYETKAKDYIVESNNYLSNKMKGQMERLEAVTSEGYWFAVYFTNDMQKQECLDKLGFNQFDKFINGKQFMRAVGKALESPDFDFGEEKRPVPEYSEIARPIKKQ